MGETLLEVLYQHTTRLDELAGQAGYTQLVLRLQKGVAWLTEVHGHIRDIEGKDHPLTQRFLDTLDQWDAMDKMVREFYDHQGCVMGLGQRCPEEAPVVCRSCGERNEPGEIGAE